MIVPDPGALLINGAQVENMTLEVHFFVNVERQKLISKFELKDQGRCYSFAPIEQIAPGKKIEIDIVERIQK